MRLPGWPWRRVAAGRPPKENDESTSEGDEMGLGNESGEFQEWDDELEEGDEETEGSEQATDELADLDDDTRARVEAYAEKQRAAAVDARTGEWRAQFQEKGFDLSADGRPLIADPAKVAGFVSTLQPAAQRPDLLPAARAAEADDMDEIPDSVTDPAGHRQWVQQQIDSRVAAAVTEIKSRQDATDHWHLEQRERAAVQRVRELIPGTRLAELAAPENVNRFTEEFVKLLRDTNPEHWTDEGLETIAGATIAKVFPRGKQGRDDVGRYTTAQSRNARMYQDSHQPHPDGGRAPRNPPPSDEERREAARYEMSVTEMRALSGPHVTLADYHAAKKSQEKKKT